MEKQKEVALTRNSQLELRVYLKFSLLRLLFSFELFQLLFFSLYKVFHFLKVSIGTDLKIILKDKPFHPSSSSARAPLL